MMRTSESPDCEAAQEGRGLDQFGEVAPGVVEVGNQRRLSVSLRHHLGSAAVG